MGVERGVGVEQREGKRGSFPRVGCEHYLERHLVMEGIVSEIWPLLLLLPLLVGLFLLLLLSMLLGCLCCYCCCPLDCLSFIAVAC